jgi:hypothetical protein
MSAGNVKPNQDENTEDSSKPKKKKQKGPQRNEKSLSKLKEALGPTKVEIKGKANELRDVLRKSVELIAGIGSLLQKAQADFREAGHKKAFRAWMEKDCSIPYRTCRYYIKIAEEVKEDPKLLTMGLTQESRRQ